MRSLNRPVIEWPQGSTVPMPDSDSAVSDSVVRLSQQSSASGLTFASLLRIAEEIEAEENAEQNKVQAFRFDIAWGLVLGLYVGVTTILAFLYLIS